MDIPSPAAPWPAPTRYVLAVLLLLTTIAVLLFLKPVYSTIGLGFIFAFLFYGPVQWIGKRVGGRYALGAVLFYLLVVAVLGALAWGGIDLLSARGQQLAQLLQVGAENIQDWRSGLPQRLAESLAQIAVWLAGNLIRVVVGAAGIIGQVVIALFFSFLLLVNLYQARGSLKDWFSGQLESEIRQILKELDKIWLGYLTAQVIYGVVLAAASWVQFTLLGVPYPFIMALITGLVSLIPTIGGLLSSFIVAIPCVVLGSTVFTEMSPATFAILVTLINILVTQISYNFLALPIVGKYVRLPVAVVFVGVLAGVALGSIMLAFLAVPILSTLTIIGGYLLSKVAQKEIPVTPAESETDLPGFFSQLLADKS
ncbi:MAG: hypothetical protein B6D39_03985 [Anaerolineae bacterium UTCFX2]|jgi:predicted PurR-regulated permease PerM|nr:AI-2E family transporter [Anaerolineales bacterium]OQY92910.1 MAG: hypothetical protein B6D39_03985 [Anaerolineae bacterium UTCFX2]